MTERVIKMKLERETKNCYRFQEVAEGQPPIIGTLYVQKWFFKGTPFEITVKVGYEERSE